MKKFSFLFSFFFLVLFLSGCTQIQNQETNSNVDFTLEYHLTPSTKPGMGNKGTTLTIKNNEGHFFRDYPRGKELDKKFKISSDQTENLVRFINQSDFFTLNDNYSQSGCHDGLVETMFVEIGKQEKSVNVYCEDVESIDKIKNEILQVLGSELEIPSWSGF